MSDSRWADGRIRRRRRCFDCGHRWTTYEVGIEELDRVEQIVLALATLESAHTALGRLITEIKESIAP